MYNPETKRVSQTRDVIWLNCMYYPKPNALKRGGDDANSDNEESIKSKDYDDESVESKESDDASESGKKVT